MSKRTTQGLRDILFDEIEELRSGKGDPGKSMAIANLARQIINTARVEMDFVRTIAAGDASGKPVSLGHIALGTDRTEKRGEASRASHAAAPAMGRSSSARNEAQPAFVA